jgi:hypothetical protein
MSPCTWCGEELMWFDEEEKYHDFCLDIAKAYLTKCYGDILSLSNLKEILFLDNNNISPSSIKLIFQGMGDIVA